jgi:hypothetical protein
MKIDGNRDHLMNLKKRMLVMLPVFDTSDIVEI